MYSLFHRRRYGFSLIEIMLVISITATLLAIMMYRHSYTLTRSTFNQDCELFAATLKETGTTAKRIGLLSPAKLMQVDHKTKPTSAPTVIENGYCLWVVCEKKSSKSKRTINASGVICARTPVTVGISSNYQNDAKEKIDAGVWVDIYKIDNPKAIEQMIYTSDSNDLNIGTKIGRIIFEPNMLPRYPGIITIKMSEDGSTPRSQRIDIERSGVITVNTVDGSERQGGK